MRDLRANEDVRQSTVRPLALPEIVAFPPEVDISNAACLGVDLLAALRHGASVVIADLTATEFCDSSGIRHLLIAHQRAKKSLADLRIVVTANAVRRVLRVTGVDQVLAIYPCLQEALTGAPASTTAAPYTPRPRENY